MPRYLSRSATASQCAAPLRRIRTGTCAGNRRQRQGVIRIDVFRRSRWPRTMCIATVRQVALRFLALCERGARRVQPDHEFGEYYTKDNSAEVPLQVFGGVMETPNALSSKDAFVP